MPSFFDPIRAKFNPPKDVRPSYEGRTIIVTGANDGLDLEAAVKFVQLGADHVILAVRNVQKGEDAKSQIETRTGRNGVLEVWELDMLDYGSISKFSSRVDSELPRLDVAVLNVGLWVAEFGLSKYGWEKTLQVNTISTALLGLLLLPKLKASTSADRAPVLEVVRSINREFASLRTGAREAESPLKIYNETEGYSAYEQYNISKLFLMHVQAGLVRTLAAVDHDKPPVEIVVVCPGATASNLTRDYDQWYMGIVKFLLGILIMKPTEQGARTYISGTDLRGKGHGRLWTADTIKEPTPLLVGAENEKLQIKVWENILRILTNELPQEQSRILQNLATDGSKVAQPGEA